MFHFAGATMSGVNDKHESPMENGGTPLFSEISSENAPVKAERSFKRAKRNSRSSPRKSESSETELPKSLSGSLATSKPMPFSKNSKKSRNSKGKALPKGKSNSVVILFAMHSDLFCPRWCWR